jgi:hypothetical protein
MKFSKNIYHLPLKISPVFKQFHNEIKQQRTNFI